MAGRVSPVPRVLTEIRDELREHRSLLREHGERLGAIERRQTESEVRLASEIVAVADAVGQVHGWRAQRLVLSPWALGRSACSGAVDVLVEAYTIRSSRRAHPARLGQSSNLGSKTL